MISKEEARRTLEAHLRDREPRFSAIYISETTHDGGISDSLGRFVLGEPYKTYWLAFVDYAPTAGWVHGCSYYALDASTGTITERVHDAPPNTEEIQLEPFFTEQK